MSAPLFQVGDVVRLRHRPGRRPQDFRRVVEVLPHNRDSPVSAPWQLYVVERPGLFLGSRSVQPEDDLELVDVGPA